MMTSVMNGIWSNGLNKQELDMIGDGLEKKDRKILYIFLNTSGNLRLSTPDRIYLRNSSHIWRFSFTNFIWGFPYFMNYWDNETYNCPI